MTSLQSHFHFKQPIKCRECVSKARVGMSAWQTTAALACTERCFSPVKGESKIFMNTMKTTTKFFVFYFFVVTCQATVHFENTYKRTKKTSGVTASIMNTAPNTSLKNMLYAYMSTDGSTPRSIWRLSTFEIKTESLPCVALIAEGDLAENFATRYQKIPSILVSKCHWNTFSTRCRRPPARSRSPCLSAPQHLARTAWGTRTAVRHIPLFML